MGWSRGDDVEIQKRFKSILQKFLKCFIKIGDIEWRVSIVQAKR